MNALQIVVIACGKKKTTTASEAARLYTSTQFKYSLAYARSIASADRIRILSAKHGLLKLDDSIEPYDCTWGDVGCVTLDALRKQASVEVTNRWLSFMPKRYYAFFSLAVPSAVNIKPKGLNMFTLCSWTRSHFGEVVFNE